MHDKSSSSQPCWCSPIPVALRAASQDQVWTGIAHLLLRRSRGFLLGPKLEEARKAGHSAAEARLFEWNLRTQLTVWGTSNAGGSEVEDYANREWAGLISSYYKPRCCLLPEHCSLDAIASPACQVLDCTGVG